MPSVLAVLTGTPDRLPPRAAEIEPRRDASSDERGFGDAFAERAATREPQRAESERQQRNKREERDGQTEATSEKPHSRSESGRRATSPGASPTARSKIIESAEPELGEGEFALTGTLFDPEVLAQSVADPAVNVDVGEAPAIVDAVTAALTLSQNADGDAALSPSPAQTLLIAPLAAPVKAAASEADSEPVEALATAATTRLAPAIESAPSPHQTSTTASAPGETAVLDRAKTEDVTKADEAQSRPPLSDIATETESALQPSRTEAPASPQVKAKEKSAPTRAVLEGLHDLGAPQERLAHQPASHTAAEARIAPAHFVASVDAAAQVIAAIRADKGSKEIDVRLDPPELGRVKISFAFERSDIVTATVSSERTDTLDLLRRHQEDLARELERAGFSKVRLDFSANDSGRAFSEQSAPQPSWREAAFGDDPIEDVRVHYLSLRTDNRLDRLV